MTRDLFAYLPGFVGHTWRIASGLTRIIHDGAVFCWQRWRKCLIWRIEHVYNQSRTPDNDCQRRHE